MKYKNEHNIDLVLAGWLVDSDYSNGASQFPNDRVISTTSLLKPVRQFVLQQQIEHDEYEIDISELIASRYGSALHDSIEKSWKNKYQHSLKKLGYPQSVIERIVINPVEPITKEQIPIYLEQRYFKKFEDIVISGQIDQCLEGKLSDIKSTSVYSYLNGSNEEKHMLQGSIYRWLAPNIITKDFMDIHYIFTDWQKFRAKTDPNYPKTRVITKTVKLLSLVETEIYIKNRLNQIKENEKLPNQNNLIECSDKELWKSDPVYKYYADPMKTVKATKNFNSLLEANEHLASKGKGIVKVVESEPKACQYCMAYTICEQRKQYFED